MSASKLNRRVFLKGAAVAAAGGLLAACAPAATPQPVEEQPPAEEAPVEEPTTETLAGSSEGTLVYWLGWPETTYGVAWNEMIKTDEYKNLIGDMKVEAKFGVPEEALLTSVAGGTPPDGIANFNYMDYMSRGVVIPIDDYITSSTVVKKEEFLEAVWDIGNFQGKQYGLPANECFVQLGFCYNAKMVTDAGLDPAKPPETCDELLEWHKTITKIDDAGNVKAIGFDPTDFMGQTIWGSSAWDVSTSWGFEWYDENTTKFNFNNENLVDYFNTAKKFVDVVGIDKLTASKSVQGQGEWGPAFYAEVLATMLDGYWEPGEMSATKPELSANNRASWLPVPTARQGTKAQGAGGHIILIFKDAKNNEMMYKLSEWLTTKTACDAIFKGIGWLPARLAYLDQVDPKTYTGLDFFLNVGQGSHLLGQDDQVPDYHLPGDDLPAAARRGIPRQHDRRSRRG